MKNLFALLIVLASIVIVACTDSDDYFFDERDSQEAKVQAYVTRSFNESSPRIKVDTITPNDSLIFLSNVYPSKAIRSQDVYWTLDGTPFASDYSFRAPVATPGLHKAAFVLIDFFGDTLSDTVTLYTAIPPTLNTEKFIPANKSQSIVPNEVLSFSWYTTEQDNAWDIFYHFVLKEAVPDSSSQEGIILDTILNSSILNLQQSLSPLSKYTWSVSATNEMGMSSTQTIKSEFFTAGISVESGILATVETSSKTIPKTALITIFDEFGDTLYNKKEFPISSDGHFYIKPIDPGKITFEATSSDAPDFKKFSKKITLTEKQVYTLDSLLFVDNTAPTISSLGNKDTLSIQDTLSFIVKDGAGKVVLSTSSALLDGNKVLDCSLNGDTLKVALPITSSWTYRYVSIEVYDLSGNKSKRIFYLQPNKAYSEVQE